MTRENERNASFMSPSKGLRGGLKAPSHHDRSIVLDEIFNDDELAQRKAEEAGKIFKVFQFFYLACMHVDGPIYNKTH